MSSGCWRARVSSHSTRSSPAGRSPTSGSPRPAPLTGDAEAVGTFFGTFTANGPLSIGLTLVILGATAAVLVGGVRSGIERVTKLMMPGLIVLLLVLAMRAVTLPGAAEGLAYYLQPDFSRLFDRTVINAALGQAFFSLSLGMGAMLTYGS